jgi:F0F1-type ATP synthase assembly protein I
MSEGQSQRSVSSSVQHRQEAEVAAAEERERKAAETAATAARAARLAMEELAAARAEVEVAAAVGYINTKDQLADLLTKPLGRIRFLELCSKTGMAQISHKTTHKTYGENDGNKSLYLIFVGVVFLSILDCF